MAGSFGHAVKNDAIREGQINDHANGLVRP